jgi:hypothetical protein
MALVNMTKQEFEQLKALVCKLERNRHFIGNAVDVGCACMTFRLALERHEPEINTAIERWGEQK